MRKIFESPFEQVARRRADIQGRENDKLVAAHAHLAVGHRSRPGAAGQTVRPSLSRLRQRRAVRSPSQSCVQTGASVKLVFVAARLEYQ